MLRIQKNVEKSIIDVIMNLDDRNINKTYLTSCKKGYYKTRAKTLFGLWHSSKNSGGG